MLFDGASLVLYMAGITVYLTNIVKGFRVVTAGVYGNLTPCAGWRAGAAGRAVVR